MQGSPYLFLSKLYSESLIGCHIFIISNLTADPCTLKNDIKGVPSAFKKDTKGPGQALLDELGAS